MEGLLDDDKGRSTPRHQRCLGLERWGFQQPKSPGKRPAQHERTSCWLVDKVDWVEKSLGEEDRQGRGSVRLRWWPRPIPD